MIQQRVIKILSVDEHHLIREGIATVGVQSSAWVSRQASNE
jgi:hypothetical protein